MFQACQICGKLFDSLTLKNKYCSDRCRKKVSYYKRKPLRKIICTRCRRIFCTRRKDKKFCSSHCRRLYNNQVSKAIKKVCRGCGIAFKSTKSQQAYHTNSCYLNYKRERDRENLRRIRRTHGDFNLI